MHCYVAFDSVKENEIYDYTASVGYKDMLIRWTEVEMKDGTKKNIPVYKERY
jgi:hypothetical protein